MSIFSHFVNFILLPVFLLSCATETKYLVKKPYLFEVKKNDKVAYFFGSMHFGIDQGDLPRKFWDYVDQSSIVITEIDQSDLDLDKEESDRLFPYIFRQKNKPLVSTYFTDKELDQIAIALEKIKPGFSKNLNELSLFGLGNLFRKQLRISFKGRLEYGDWVRSKSKFGIDRQIRGYAKKQKKHLDQLDDRMNQQWIDCVVGENSDNIAYVRKALSSNLLVIDDEETAISYAAYREGRIDGSLYSQIPACFLEGRNKFWQEKILNRIAYYDKPFFVVGALHLVANKGSVLEMLKAQGFEIRRIEELDLK